MQAPQYVGRKMLRRDHSDIPRLVHKNVIVGKMRYGGFGIIPSTARIFCPKMTFSDWQRLEIPMLLWSIITDPFKTAMACCVPYLGADSCAPSMVSSFQGTRLSIWATFWRLKAEQMECVQEVLTHHGKIQFHSN